MKKFNKMLTSGMLMGLILPLFSTSVLAYDDPESGMYDKYGDIITEDDELYKECTSDPDTYLSKNYNGIFCVVNKEDSKEWNASRDKLSYQSRNKVYYPRGEGFAPININQGAKDTLMSFGTSLDFSEFVNSKDIGKQIKIELEFHNIKHDNEQPQSQALMSQVYQLGASSKEKSSIRNGDKRIQMYGIESVYDGFSEGDFKEIQEGVLEGDVLGVNISYYIQLMPTDEYIKEISQWKSFDDIKITKNTPYLNAKIIVGDELRFDGPVSAYVGVPQNLFDEAQEKLDVRKLNEPFFHKDFLSNPDKKTTPEQYAMLRKNINMFDDFYYPKPETKDNQGINANVLNGGITGGIVNPEVGQDLSIEDIDFGKLSIGQTIESVKKDSMVSVRDWTGGNGWKLTAKHKEADRNQSLQLGVQVNENSKVDLNNEANLVTEGESQLDVITQGGEYTAKWGTHPTAGDFNNVIEWNLSANVTE